MAVNPLRGEVRDGARRINRELCRRRIWCVYIMQVETRQRRPRRKKKKVKTGREVWNWVIQQGVGNSSGEVECLSSLAGT